MNCDNLKILEKLPSYEIISRAYGINSLNMGDLDENIININSRYYTAHEFKSLHKEKSFNIFHTNLNGLENKFELFQNFISTSNIDIINISETSQKENVNFASNISLEGYSHPFILGSKTSRGGVAIYVKNNINVFMRDDLNIVDKSFEAVWVEIKTDKTKNIVCGCIYRHPNNEVELFNDYISKCLDKITKERKECYLSGDFNIDLLKYETNNKYCDFLDNITSYGFLPYILQPTRLSDENATVIDNIYGNNFEQESISGNILIQFANHLSQFLSINREINKNQTKQDLQARLF